MKISSDVPIYCAIDRVKFNDLDSKLESSGYRACTRLLTQRLGGCRLAVTSLSSSAVCNEVVSIISTIGVDPAPPSLQA